MNDEIKINKTNKSITFINNGIAFSQFGIADEILDLITNLQQENERLKEQINQYENPDDMTLFYMWLDAKAKDKMKELEQENERLNSQLDFIGEQNKYIDKLEKGYKNKVDEIGKLTSRIYKAIDKLTIKQARFINEKDYVLDDNDLDEIMYILQNGSDDNEN